MAETVLPQAKHHAAPRLGQDGQEQGQTLGREANSGPSMSQGQNLQEQSGR